MEGYNAAKVTEIKHNGVIEAELDFWNGKYRAKLVRSWCVEVPVARDEETRAELHIFELWRFTGGPYDTPDRKRRRLHLRLDGKPFYGAQFQYCTNDAHKAVQHYASMKEGCELTVGFPSGGSVRWEARAKDVYDYLEAARAQHWLDLKDALAYTYSRRDLFECPARLSGLSPRELTPKEEKTDMVKVTIQPAVKEVEEAIIAPEKSVEIGVEQFSEGSVAVGVVDAHGRIKCGHYIAIIDKDGIHPCSGFWGAVGFPRDYTTGAVRVASTK